MALTIAAAAGVGAASTAGGSQPWMASLNSMAQAGHNTSGPTAKAAGENIFAAALGAEPASAAGGGHATSTAQVTDHKESASSTAKGGAAPSHSAVVQALQPLPRHAVPQAPAPLQHFPPQSKPKPAVHHAAPKPYTIYDSVTPGQIPSGQDQVAVYGNGSYQASWSSVHGRHKVLWIDTTGGNAGCDVLDVEPGDASPATAAAWARTRLTQQPHSIAIIYTMRSEWPAVKSAIGALPHDQQRHVRYWIADPTGQAHVVPGSDATQWYWGTNYDITKALPSFGS